MEDLILEEVRRDVFKNPKPTIDMDYLYSVKKQLQEFADETNTKLKKNVYQNYSLFIESSREISTLKEEMRQLNSLLEQQQSSMNKLLDQLNKSPIIQPTIERPKVDPFRLELDEVEASEVEAEMLPAWFTKSPEDFDVLIAQRNLREAVELSQKVRDHFEQYPKCCDNNQTDLKNKIDSRLQELVSIICSELQPVTDRSVQGGPRSSIESIQLLRELGLASKAVKLYLDQRSSVLRFVIGQQRVESITTLQFMKQICSIFFHNTKETCNEFRQAFELDKYVSSALEECSEMFDTDSNGNSNDTLQFDQVRPVYLSTHPIIDNDVSPINMSNNVDISSQILSHHTERVVENSFAPVRTTSNAFLNLSTYACLTYWITQEFENFIKLYRKHLFNSANTQMPVSVVAESIYYLRNQCSSMKGHWMIDLNSSIDRELGEQIRKIIEDSGNKLVASIGDLNAKENWQPQQFQNKAQMTRFFEEMNDVGLETMPKYIFSDLKLHFTTCKTEFARYYLKTVQDLTKLSTASNKDHIDRVLAMAFELEMKHVVEALSKAKIQSKIRFIMSNSNFLFKVADVANELYISTTKSRSLNCKRLITLQEKYQNLIKTKAATMMASMN